MWSMHRIDLTIKGVQVKKSWRCVDSSLLDKLLLAVTKNKPVLYLELKLSKRMEKLINYKKTFEG